MRMGQGATMALPIWAKYMKKVFSDKSLGYKSDEQFNIPEDFQLCDKAANDSITDNGIDDIFQ